MQDHIPARTGAASRPMLREERTGPPRPSGNAHAMTIGFGLLLTASLVIRAFTDAALTNGPLLVFAGLMGALGVAELMDPRRRRLVIGTRIGGMVIALLGLVIQFVPGLG
ncbi:hypothetical protein [Brachybacterium alimentarium]|uniref:hypothetical protein n=1 Tax=Brachybacterium alimentarium TaxID=47845 RepID=UPI000DF1B05E|nr:hypothetical protein [Brachybacterium alimentarium]RCS76906.1 hypothetical protein CIK72_15100 [Brachybacterium alimentarium]